MKNTSEPTEESPLGVSRTVRASRQDEMKRAAHAVNLGGIADLDSSHVERQGRFFVFLHPFLLRLNYTQEGFYYA